MPAIASRFCEQFGLTTPIALAPMAGAAGGALALACARAGALGLVGGGYGDLDWVKTEYDKAFTQTDCNTLKRLGMGFITWRLNTDASALDWVLDQASKPAAMMFSFGDPSQYAARVQHHNIPIICQAQRVEQVPKLIEAGAQVIVAQGGEAGGHGMRNEFARGTFTLVPEIADWLAKHSPDTLLLAAGGVADGRGLAAAMMLGADGGVVGSRLWVTKECLAPVAALHQAVDATGDDTARSSVFDVLRNLEWPAPYDFRALRNDLHRQWEGRLEPLREQPEPARKDYQQGVSQQDYSRAHVTVGEATGLIHDIPSATTVIETMSKQANRLLGQG